MVSQPATQPASAPHLLAVIKDQQLQTAELQSFPKSSQGPQVHLAINDLQGGNWASGVSLRLQEQSLEDEKILPSGQRLRS